MKAAALTRAGLVAATFAVAAPASGCGQDAASDPGAVRDRAEALLAEGEYEQALALIDRRAVKSAAGDRRFELERVRGDALARLGRLEPARAAYRAAVEENASDAVLATLGLADLDWRAGRVATAIAGYDRVIDAYNTSGRLTADELVAVGSALRALASRDPALVREAQRAFGEAMEAAPEDPAPRVALGELFLERYNSLDAGELFREALAVDSSHAGALLGLARRAEFDGSREALELVNRALETNPNLVPARVFLARLHLVLEDTDAARKEARRALDVNPTSLEAQSILAAALHLEGDARGFARQVDAILEANPAYADLYSELAEVSYRTHRYADAVGFASRGVELDPQSWRAYTLLGLNQLRVGRMEAGRATLETAFEGDPFNVWVKNTLDLLDNLETFESVESARFHIWMEPGEAEILGIYAPRLAEEAFARMSERYGYQPPTPIRLEIFPRHADFSVRTFGLTGLGALGVSFGSVLAMDSPAARESGSFNWGSTLWHEISHAFTLGYTDHRVPRWLSEGLAVLDERRARSGWGAAVAPDFLLAFKQERLPPLSDFNAGFVRPRYPGQVQHSYFLASLLAEMIEQEEGMDVILALLAAYRDGRDTPGAFQSVFGTDLETFDLRFRRWVEVQYAGPLAALEADAATGGPSGGGAGAARPGATGFAGPFAEALRAGAEKVLAGQREEAISDLERAKSLFPQYTGHDAPPLMLARIHADAGRDGRAMAELRHFLQYNETNYPAHEQLAGFEAAAGESAAAAETLGRAVWIDPYAPALHATRAELLEATGDWAAAVVERRAVLALDPTDRADAWFRLARARARAGDAPGARRDVLRALEIAPGFDLALELLLELNEGGGR